MRDAIRKWTVTGYRQARRLVVLVLGVSIVLVGVLMIVLPGPAMVVIPLGLGILAIEFAWARRWLKQIGKTVEDVRKNFTGTEAERPQNDRPLSKEHDDSSVAGL